MENHGQDGLEANLMLAPKARQLRMKEKEKKEDADGSP